MMARARPRPMVVPAIVAFALAVSGTLAAGTAEADPSSYGIAGAHATVSTSQAGAHPDVSVRLDLKRDPATGVSFSGTRSAAIAFPKGLAANLAAYPSCPLERFFAAASGSEEAESCPFDSQVGLARIGLPIGPQEVWVAPAPIYNLAASDSMPARLGFAFGRLAVPIGFNLRGDYGFTATIEGFPDLLPIVSIETTVWGTPSDPSHDPERLTPTEAFECGYPCGAPGDKRPSRVARIPFLTNPTTCGPAEISARLVSYGAPSSPSEASMDLPKIAGCSKLTFDPEAAVSLTTRSVESPSGLELNLDMPRAGLEEAGGIAAAALRGVQVDLPEGVALNPAAASGLQACSANQVGLVGDSPIRFDSAPAHCPPASRIGEAELRTPLVPTPLRGPVYLADQADNPFAGPFAAYLIAAAKGLVVKLAVRLQPDDQNGKIALSIDDLPEDPFESIDLRLDAGPRAILSSPPACGDFHAGLSLTSWVGQVVERSSTLVVDSGPDENPCPDGRFSPRFEAGSQRAAAGASSPFEARLSREPGEQRLADLQFELPPGLAVNLRGVPLCGDGDAAAGDCPAATRIGELSLAVGSGPKPLSLPESGGPPAPVFLGGPYEGAPYSIVAELPAQAGPFDLGRQTLRGALSVDPSNARIGVSLDPLPQFLDGLPLDYRALRLRIDRPGFIHDPTSCASTRIVGSATAGDGSTAPISSPFGVRGCGRLRFHPRLWAGLSGGLGRNSHPGLRAVLRMGKGEAGVKGLALTLPKGEMLDFRHIRELCPRILGAKSCPAASRIGRVRLLSPYLAAPLLGAVYLREPSKGLPDLLADVRGGGIRLLIRGRTTAPGGRLRWGLDSLPDLPFSRAIFTVRGGAPGVLVNSQGLCQGPKRATVVIRAHSGKRVALQSPLHLEGKCHPGSG